MWYTPRRTPSRRRDAALDSMANALRSFYARDYPDVLSSRAADVDKAAAPGKTKYSTNTRRAQTVTTGERVAMSSFLRIT